MFVSFAGFISPYYAPLSERIRKRKAFADQELMQSTLNCYLNFQHHHQHMQSTFSQPDIDFSINLLNAKPINSETQTRPKISFSIESIIGIKWLKSLQFSKRNSIKLLFFQIFSCCFSHTEMLSQVIARLIF
jgi:hypothetical protein